MVNDKRKRTTIAISQQTKDGLDSIKHPGQTYDGVIQELIKFWKKAHQLEETVQVASGVRQSILPRLDLPGLVAAEHLAQCGYPAGSG